MFRERFSFISNHSQISAQLSNAKIGREAALSASGGGNKFRRHQTTDQNQDSHHGLTYVYRILLTIQKLYGCFIEQQIW